LRFTTIRVKLSSPLGGFVDGIILVTNGKAVCKFSDPNLARRLTKVEKKAGKNVVYSKGNNAMIEYFRGKKMEEIVKILGTQIKKAGGRYEENNDKYNNEKV